MRFVACARTVIPTILFVRDNIHRNESSNSGPKPSTSRSQNLFSSLILTFFNSNRALSDISRAHLNVAQTRCSTNGTEFWADSKLKVKSPKHTRA